MNKEDSLKEKFKQALISTAKVISDDIFSTWCFELTRPYINSRKFNNDKKKIRRGLEETKHVDIDRMIGRKRKIFDYKYKNILILKLK